MHPLRLSGGGGGASHNLGEVLARLATPGGGAAAPLDDFLYSRPAQNRLAAENAAARCARSCACACAAAACPRVCVWRGRVVMARALIRLCVVCVCGCVCFRRCLSLFSRERRAAPAGGFAPASAPPPPAAIQARA
jgi:hypothetical protein